ncbi:hypothetical protein [Erythrobacter sp. Alg231-14]|uniref:hypothetical protein n=1 Tax=Erythrobacter sp. Alg231-14 TaxID=1922225 RepID=UPI000D55CAE5
MTDLAPTSHVSNDLHRGELYFSIAGLWELEDMKDFVIELNKNAWPLVKAGHKIHVIGAMEGFVPQTRETGDVIRDHLIESRQHGLTRVALYGASSLVKLQYKRLSKGIDVEFFDSKFEAARWLRRPYEDAA